MPVCLSVFMFHHFLRMAKYFFQKLWIWTFEALLRWSQTKNSHLSPTLGKGAFWVIFAHFCVFFCFFFTFLIFLRIYVPIFLENHSLFFHELLYRCSWYTLTVTALFFHPCYVHLGPIMVYVPLFLKNRSIFSHEILYIL